MRNKLSLQSAFSLIETAIALGVIGTVIGFVWSYASTSYENVKREQTLEQVTSVVGNVRTYFQSQRAMPLSGVKLYTPLFVYANVIPNNMARISTTTCTGGNTGNICADTPWGSNGSSANGTFQVCDWVLGQTDCTLGTTLGNPTQYFGVSLRGLSYGSCIALGGKLSSPAGPAGLYDVIINTKSISGLGSGHPIQPVSAADLNTYCKLTAPPSLYYIITFVYRLRAQEF